MEPRYHPFWRSILMCCFQAVAFGLVSYGIMCVAYGGVRIALLAWFAIVIVAFLLVHIPTFVQLWRRARRKRPG